MTPPADPCYYIASRRIPLYVRGHEMFPGVHAGHVVGVDELKITVHAAKVGWKKPPF